MKTVSETDAFGNSIMKEYPQLKNMEFLIKFDNYGNPETAFCRQPYHGQESMACSGTVTEISSLGISTWDELLEYYCVHRANVQ